MPVHIRLVTMPTSLVCGIVRLPFQFGCERCSDCVVAAARVARDAGAEVNLLAGLLVFLRKIRKVLRIRDDDLVREPDAHRRWLVRRSRLGFSDAVACGQKEIWRKERAGAAPQRLPRGIDRDHEAR